MVPVRPSLTVVLAATCLFLTACASSPRGSASDPSDPLPPPPSEKERDATGRSRDAAYDFESEGRFPPPSRDVEFEEDQLPPPETVDGTAWGTTAEPVQDETLEREEPSVVGPVAPSGPRTQPGAGAVEEDRGWRVQLAASSERDDADRLAREARSRLGVPVYVDFEAPLYKIRAGDYIDRAEALRLRDRARANGYDGAWVVTTEIARKVNGGS